MANAGGRYDESVLIPSMQTGLTGVELILESMKNGSEEVRKLLLQECDVIYECRVCRSMFRSLANYITHKRAYCRQSALAKAIGSLGLGRNGDDNNDNNGDLDETSNDSVTAKDDDVDSVDGGSVTEPETRSATKVTLNLLKRLTKRLVNTAMGETNFVNGFQRVTRKPPSALLLEKATKPSQEVPAEQSDVTIVLPEEPAHRLHSMELRLRRSANASKFVRTVSREELAIITRLECCDTCDLITKRCLVERCKRTFPDLETLAYHLNYSHGDVRPNGPAMCFLCGKQLTGFRALRAHIQLSHRVVARRYNEEVMKRWGEQPKKYSGSFRHVSRQTAGNNNVVFVREVPPVTNVLPTPMISPPASVNQPEDVRSTEIRKPNEGSPGKPPLPEASEGQTATALTTARTILPCAERRIVTLHSSTGKKEPSIMLFDKSRNIVLQLTRASASAIDVNNGQQMTKNVVTLVPKLVLSSTIPTWKVATANEASSGLRMKPSPLALLPLSQPNPAESADSFTLSILTLSDVERALRALCFDYVPDAADSPTGNTDRSGDLKKLRTRSFRQKTRATSIEQVEKRMLKSSCGRSRKFVGTRTVRKVFSSKQRWSRRRRAAAVFSRRRQSSNAGIGQSKELEERTEHDKAPLLEEASSCSSSTKAAPQLRVRRCFKSPYNSEEYATMLPGFREDRGDRVATTASKERASRSERSEGRSDSRDRSDSRFGQHRSSSPGRLRGSTSVTAADSSKALAVSGDSDCKWPVIFTRAQRQQLEQVADLKRFLCVRCGSQFTTRSNTERHCYAHLRFVRFRCRLCNTGAFYRSDMQRHLIKQCTKVKSRHLSTNQFKQNIVPCCQSQPGKVVSWRGYPVVWTRSLRQPRATRAVMLARAAATPAASRKRPLSERTSVRSERSDCEKSKVHSPPVGCYPSSSSQKSCAEDRPSVTTPASGRAANLPPGACSSCPVHGKINGGSSALRDALMTPVTTTSRTVSISTSTLAPALAALIEVGREKAKHSASGRALFSVVAANALHHSPPNSSLKKEEASGSTKESTVVSPRASAHDGPTPVVETVSAEASFLAVTPTPAAK